MSVLTKITETVMEKVNTEITLYEVCAIIIKVKTRISIKHCLYTMIPNAILS